MSKLYALDYSCCKIWGSNYTLPTFIPDNEEVSIKWKWKRFSMFNEMEMMANFYYFCNNLNSTTKKNSVKEDKKRVEIKLNCKLIFIWVFSCWKFLIKLKVLFHVRKFSIFISWWQFIWLEGKKHIEFHYV
jgi:hypothetical protein